MTAIAVRIRSPSKGTSEFAQGAEEMGESIRLWEAGTLNVESFKGGVTYFMVSGRSLVNNPQHLLGFLAKSPNRHLAGSRIVQTILGTEILSGAS